MADPILYDRFPKSLPPYIGAVMFETFLYGLYVILFAICAYVLLRRNKNLHWILLTFAVVMFAIASADMIYTYYVLFCRVLKGGLKFDHLKPKYLMYVSNNVLADTLLLYRCYVVWEYKKLIIVVCGYIFEGSSSELFDKAYIYLILTLVLNVILTCLTAGRIWWLARRARLVLGAGLLQRYNATITILIESGLVYSIYIILNLALRNTKVINTILDAGLIQVVGIMPTLIIVQVGLGRAVHDIEANEAIARLESNKGTAMMNRSYSDVIHCVRSREYQQTSSDMFAVAESEATLPLS
ncbi:hypothetical protein CVT25_000371 [Psilocybe cyanescens]|uniref:Uncharacterized protein n=1 Tax=Psilocybe cyanescens TaxID=93625 RepID=A0A409XEY3_PSICY|nr:hypothetical protein CVT25_000371 [Psilocybe cyanescens]